MELKDFNELCKRDFDNGAVRDAIRQVFEERDELQQVFKECNKLRNKACPIKRCPNTEKSGRELMRVPYWWDLSKRLRRYLISHGNSVFAYKWTEQCGQWVMLVYKECKGGNTHEPTTTRIR